ncbi:DUF2793 domain-containing protein [Ancylobacter dichloromethanicus]|uniref:DUF2793 domain-containing protein n=1 Tax=Ancylobacter dichloromethanicus TaxID=518825 RepID=A0A9W6J9F3_9HYPH|nr:DUF2793 domain-containing protein [Ancylobacter dichloromethanicus]MBS7554590.1 DUF2793 domain-containing protein [Ancylobacter dichloromethanicus]GLK71720.1 hypothetical protein GCM10017643_18350 [Ancylobacter dichloromethanicus]
MAEFYYAGTVSVSPAGTTVTGAGVVWSDVLAGDTLELVGQRVTVAAAPASPYTSLTLAAPWSGAAQADAAYVIRYDAPQRFTAAYMATQVRALVAKAGIIEAALPCYRVQAVGNAPPGAPVAGDMYALGAAPTGAWAGKAGNLAQWTGAGWQFTMPGVGWLAYVGGAGLYVFDAGWAAFPG